MSKEEKEAVEKEVEKELEKEVEKDKDDDDKEEDEEEEDSEYEEIDVTDNPLYQVLSAFFETEEGENVCDILKDLSDAVRDNTKMMSKFLKQQAKQAKSK